MKNIKQIIIMIQNSFQKVKMLSKSEWLIIISQAISTIGDIVALPAFLVIALDRGQYVPGVFLFVSFMPRIFQPFLGTLIDKFNPKKILLISEFLRGVIYIILFLYPLSYPTAGWLILPFLSSILTCLFTPSRIKVMGKICDNFVFLNSIFYFFYSITGIFSVFLAIAIEKYFQTKDIFLLNGFSFFISFILLCFISYTHTQSKTAYKIFEAFKFFKTFKLVFVYTLFVVIIDFFSGVMYEMFPGKSENIGLPVYGTYILTSMVCVGNTVGAMLFPKIYRSVGYLYFLPVIFVCNLMVFLFTDNIVMSLLSCVLFFCFQMMGVGLSEIAIQSNVPEEFHGRMFAINESLPIAALSIGSLYAGFFNRNVLYITAIFLLVFFLIVISTLKQSIVIETNSTLSP